MPVFRASDVCQLLHTHRSPRETAALAGCAAECVNIRTLSGVYRPSIRAGKCVVLSVEGATISVVRIRFDRESKDPDDVER